MIRQDQPNTPGIRLKLAAINALTWCLARLGDNGRRRMGKALAPLAWLAMGKRRAIATENTRLLIGLSPARQRQIARRSVTHYCMSMLNVLYGGDDVAAKIEVAQPDLLEALRTETRPVLAISGHLGAWELIAGGFVGQLAKRPQMTVSYTQSHDLIEQVKLERLIQRGVNVIPARNGIFEACRGLRQPRALLTMQADQNTHPKQALFMPFLGKEAGVNKGPATICLRTNALLWPVYILRLPSVYLLHLEPPLDPLSLCGSHEEKLRQLCAFANSSLENMVRLYPEQWLWIHRRWKSRPPHEQAGQN